jgi:hypothetical protein
MEWSMRTKQEEEETRTRGELNRFCKFSGKKSWGQPGLSNGVEREFKIILDFKELDNHQETSGLHSH